MNKEDILKKIDEINKILSDLCYELNKCTDYEIELQEVDLTDTSSIYPKKRYCIVVTSKEVLR